MSHSAPHTTPDGSAGRKYETSDAHFKNVFVTGVALLGIMVFGLLLSWGVYTLWSHYTAAPGTRAETLTRPDLSKQPPGPNLQANPHAALLAMRRAEDSVLTRYAWINKDSGIVQVPVERAMELLVRKGLLHHEAKVSQ
jgi:hypothetical protein